MCLWPTLRGPQPQTIELRGSLRDAGTMQRTVSQQIYLKAYAMPPTSLCISSFLVHSALRSHRIALCQCLCKASQDMPYMWQIKLHSIAFGQCFCQASLDLPYVLPMKIDSRSIRVCVWPMHFGGVCAELLADVVAGR